MRTADPDSPGGYCTECMAALDRHEAALRAALQKKLNTDRRKCLGCGELCAHRVCAYVYATGHRLSACLACRLACSCMRSVGRTLRARANRSKTREMVVLSVAL